MMKIVQGLAIVHPQPLKDFYHHSFSFRESREKCVFATSPLNYPHAHLWAAIIQERRLMEKVGK